MCAKMQANPPRRNATLEAKRRTREPEDETHGNGPKPARGQGLLDGLAVPSSCGGRGRGMDTVSYRRKGEQEIDDRE